MAALLRDRREERIGKWTARVHGEGESAGPGHGARLVVGLGATAREREAKEAVRATGERGHMSPYAGSGSRS
jgi:hypothetical protein